MPQLADSGPKSWRNAILIRDLERRVTHQKGSFTVIFCFSMPAQPSEHGADPATSEHYQISPQFKRLHGSLDFTISVAVMFWSSSLRSRRSGRLRNYLRKRPQTSKCVRGTASPLPAISLHLLCKVSARLVLNSPFIPTIQPRVPHPRPP